MSLSLERELREQLRGDVLFDGASRALYAADASNYRQVPIGVVRPKDSADVEKALWKTFLERLERHEPQVAGEEQDALVASREVGQRADERSAHGSVAPSSSIACR